MNIKITEQGMNRKAVLRNLVITVFVAYGIHYFGYFIRVRYFNSIAFLSSENAALHSILRYLGHLIFWAVFALYVLFVQEDRKCFRLFSPHYAKNGIGRLLIGMLIGFAMNATCVMAAKLHGDLSITTAENPNITLFILAFFAVLIQASQEELESRAFVFCKIKSGGMSFTSSVIAAGIYFAYLHANNPGFGFKPFISLVFDGTVYLLLFVYFDSIWTACGMHQLWNVTQDFIFGLPNSGNPSEMSIFVSEAKGNSFFYDTAFGVEGSMFCIILHIAVTIILGLLIKKRTFANPYEEGIAK